MESENLANLKIVIIPNGPKALCVRFLYLPDSSWARIVMVVWKSNELARWPVGCLLDMDVIH